MATQLHNNITRVTESGTHEDEKTVHYKTKSLHGNKPNTNPKTKTKTNPNPKLTQILTLFSCFMLFFEHRPLMFSLAQNHIVILHVEHYN